MFRQSYSLFAAVGLGVVLTLCGLFTLDSACTPAQVTEAKAGARTVLNVAQTGCDLAPIVGAIVLTDVEGQAVETICADEAELRPLIDRLLAARRAKALAKAKAMGTIAIPPDAGGD